MAVAQAKAGASAKEKSIEMKKFLTHEFRVSFPSVFEVKQWQGQNPKDAKHEITMLFSKNADLGSVPLKKDGKTPFCKYSMKAAVKNAADEKWGAGKWDAKKITMPFNDGDDKEDMDGYPGHIYVKAKSKIAPQVHGKDNKPIENQADFYAGCYARAELIAFAYEHAGKRGVSFSLQSVQKTKEGESFSGRRDASEAFEAVEDDSESADSYSGGDDAAGDEYDF